jgi:lipopolysaccharide biosynthesis glycosyltransferase
MAATVQHDLLSATVLRPTVGSQPDEMQVLCACDGRYLPHAATMLCSLLEHNNVSKIHLFYSSIAAYELAKLKAFVAKYRTTLVCYDLGLADLQGLKVDKHISVAVYYRLLATRLLSHDIARILYLDSDLIVRRSLRSLWNIDLTDYGLAAVVDYEEEEAPKTLGFPLGTKYFNSGVMLINLQFWKQYNVAARAINFIRENPEKVRYWDQDGLNAILVTQWIELSDYWNAQSGAGWVGENPAIVHFSSPRKPWEWSSKHYSFEHEYRKYRLKTPWRRYREEGRPSPLRRFGYFLRSFARAVLPGSVRQRLRQYACRLGLRK